jgi:hypothetical protein
VFHCDLLSRETSSTSLRPHQAEIGGDNEEYVVDSISDIKIDYWPRRRGPYLQFLIHFVSFDILEWMLLEHVNDCEPLYIFLQNAERWNVFSLGKVCLEIVANYPMRNMVSCSQMVVCLLFIYFLIILRGRILMGGRSNVTATSQYVPNIVHSHR